MNTFCEVPPAVIKKKVRRLRDDDDDDDETTFFSGFPFFPSLEENLIRVRYIFNCFYISLSLASSNAFG